MNTIATAAVEVTSGATIPIRKNVAARIRRFSAFATSSATSSCGTVETAKIPRVLTAACQKSASDSR
ncbi:hypothetical protein ACFQHO_05760 [Actinomadura yumaensis]|uniref:hypothetical protein n=1 Tax=Actinomadura yumaensis TaxID=111807 RepID=UPI00361492F0